MSKGWKAITTILLVIIILLVLIIAAYYLILITRKNIVNDDKNIQSGQSAIGSEKNIAPVINNGKEGYVKKVSLNGKEHTVTFKYNYDKGKEEKWDGEDYIYHYITVNLDIYFDNSLIKENLPFTQSGYSEYLSRDKTKPLETVTIEEVEKSMEDQEFIKENIKLRVIKGKSNNEIKEYLYLTSYAIPDEKALMPQRFIPYIINDEGRILKEITDNNYLKGANVRLTNEKEDKKFDFEGFNIYTKDNITQIEYIAHNVDENTKEVFFAAIKTISVEDENIIEAVGVLTANEYILKK